jgi:transcriptional regulator with XRE-family HTH domain
MADTYKTAADLATSILGEDAGKKVADLTAGRQIITALVSVRLGKGMTQKQVSDRMGCSASAISKLESGTDADLRWSEIGKYSRAIGIQSALVLDNPSLPVTSRIKHRVIEIGELLDEIVELAHIVDDDPEIIESIHGFYKELSYNFYLRYERTKGRLPKIMSWDQSEPLVELDTSDCSNHEAGLLEHVGN